MAFKRNIFFNTTLITVISLFAALAIALIVLAGWAFQVNLFITFYPGLASMKANAALAILFAGLSLLLFLNGKYNRFAVLLSAFVFLIGAVTFSEFLFHWDASVDELLFRDTITPGENNPGRMSLATSLALIMLGASLLLYRFKHKKIYRISNILSSISFFIAFTPFAGYLYDVKDLYKDFGFSAISLPATLSLMLVSIAVFFSRPGSVFLSAFNKPTVAGKTGFQGALLTIFLLFIISWLKVQGQEAGLYSTGFGVALMVIAFILSIFILTWWRTNKLNIAEEEKDKLLKLIQESDAYSRSILSSLRAAIAVIDAEGKIVTVNKAWENFAAENGVTTLERVARGANYFTVCNKAAAAGDEIAAQAIKGIQSVLQKERKVFELQYPCHSPSKQRWFLLRVMPFESEKPMVVVSHNDITEIVLASMKVEESETSLRQIMDNSSGMIASFDREHQVIVFNKATEFEYKRFCGKDLKRGDIVYKVFPPDAQLVWETKINEALTGNPVKFERNYIIGDRKIYAEIFVYPIRKGSCIEGVTCFVSNITERKIAELEMEESQKKYRSLFDNSADGILLTIPDGQVLTANKAACEIFGMTEDEICAAGRTGLVDMTDPNLPVLLQERRLTGKTNGELIFKRKDGTKFTGEITSVIFKDVSGNERSSMIIRDISKRKETEKLVKISEARLRKAQQVAHVGSWYHNFRDNSVQWSDETYRIFNVSPDTYNPAIDSLIQLVHPADQQAMLEHLDKFSNGINSGELQFRILFPDGSVRYVNGRGDIKFDKEGKPVSITGTVQDITSMKLAEEKVIESETRLRTIFNTEPECIKLLNPKGELLDMNPAGLAMIEADNLEMVKGKSVFGIIAPEHRVGFEKLTQMVFEEGRAGNMQFRIIGLKGTSRWLETHAVPMKDDGGNIISLLSVTRDITDKKKAEEQKYRLLGVLQKSLNEIYIFDPATFQFEYVNDAALDNLGYTMEAMAGMTPLDIKPEFTPGKIKKLIAPLFNHEQEKVIFETVHKRADGSLYPVEVHLQLITHEEESVFLAVIQDITVRKNAEREIRESEKKLREVTSSLPGIVYQYKINQERKIEFTFLSKSISRYQDDNPEDIYRDSRLLFSKVHPDDTGRLMLAIESANKKMAPLSVQYRIQVKDGSYVWMRSDSTPEKLDDGTIVRNGSLLDISASIAAEQKIKESEEKYRNLMQQAGDAIFIFDKTGKISDVNVSSAKLVGHTEKELRKMNITDFAFVEDLEAMPFKFDELNKGISTISQRRIKRKDGTSVILEIHTKQLPNGLYLAAGRDLTERIKAEQELRDSESKYRTLIENADEAIIIGNRKSRLLEANATAVKLFGYSKEEFSSLGIEDIILVEEGEQPIRYKDIEEGRPVHMIRTAKRKDGSLFKFEVHTQTMPDGNIIGFGRDVTERLKAEEIFHQNEKKIRDITSAVPGVLYQTNYGKNGTLKFTYISEGISRFINAGPEDLYKNSNLFFTFTHPDDTEKVKKTIVEANKELKSFKVVFRLLAPDGNYTWVQAESVFLGIENGTIIRSGSLTDITETIEASRKIEESEEKYRSIVERNLAGIYQTTPEGKILTSNASFANMLGYTPRQFKELNAESFYLSKTDRKRFIKEIREKREILNREIVLMHKDGHPVHLMESCFFHVDPLSGKEFIEGVVIDITERKKAEQALSESEETFRRLFNESADSILLLDDTGFTECNQAAATILGYPSPKEVLIKQPWEISPKRQPDGRLSTEKAAAMIAKALRKGYNRFEWIHTKADGTEFPVEVMLTPIVLKGKQCFYTVWRDIAERKKAEKELAESENRYRSLVEQASDGILLADMQGNILEVNAALCSMFGYKKEEALQKKVTVFLDAGELKTKPIRFDLLQKGHSLLMERKAIHKNKNHFDIEFSSKRIGEGIVLSFIRDISDRKKAEEQIHLSEARYRSFFDQSADAIFIFNDKGYFTDVNKVATELLGYTDKELKKMSVLDIVFRQDMSANPIRLDLLSAGKAVIRQRIFKRKNGTGVQVEVHSRQLPGGNYLGIVRDITERKKAEETIKESEARYRTIIETTDEMLHRLSLDGKIIWVNEAWKTNMGYTDNEVIGKKLTDFIDASTKIEFGKVFPQLVKGKKVSGLSCTYITKKGEVIFLEGQALPVINNGKVIGTQAFLRNVTERKKAEMALEESYQSVRKLTEHLQHIREEERTHIAREIHDELGQQLTVMMMDLSWLGRKIEPGNKLAMNKIKELMGLMGNMVKTVRRISTELRPSVLDDLGLVSAIELHLREFGKRTGIHTRLIVPETEPLLDKPVREGLYRIFQESLTNVARHSQAKVAVVKLERKNANIILTINDNGVGFDEKKAKEKRTLGLLGMKERATGIGGSYQISGKPGKGTTIIVTVPIPE